jgi:hypothetical protein
MLGATRAAGILGGIAERRAQGAKEVQMSVLALFRWKGDPEQLLRAYERELEHPVAGSNTGVEPMSAPEPPTDGDRRRWESEEDFRAMMDDPEFQRHLQESGTPEPETLDVWTVHASIP